METYGPATRKLMLCTYGRSSSLSEFNFCEQKYFLTYVLGYRGKTTRKQLLGTCTHKCLELLAWKKKSIQDGRKSFTDDTGEWSISNCDDVNYLIEWVYEYYDNQEPNVELRRDDLKTVKKWVSRAVRYRDRLYDPREQYIIQPEAHFNFPIERDWAYYTFYLGDKKIQGQFHLKGTIDLIVKNRNDVYEYIDYKTGVRKKFPTNKIKSYEDFEDDVQLGLYHYAASHLFPSVHSWIGTIFYINDGGPFSLCQEDHDLNKTEQKIKETFEKIKQTETPTLWDDNRQHWACRYVCPFSDSHNLGGNKCDCQYAKELIQQYGIDYVTKHYMRQGHSVDEYHAPG